ncbi:MAG: response regulator [Chloroflexota bacterium]|nr:response regulator [Chloroflexota bacterium]
MRQSNERDIEIMELREKLSRLSEASLRISESLDFETVLQGVLDSARSLTRARYGVMTLLNETGQVLDFLSSGMTSEEADRVWSLPDRWGLFEYLSKLFEPLRIPDLLGHARSLGLAEFSVPLPVGQRVSFLASPVFNLGDRVGNLYLADKDGGEEFTSSDEETLLMFASQAGMIISNARRYRDEQRARKDLESLIDTSPVGVVVFDAETGMPVSINREAARIVEILREPDQPAEQILDVLTFIRGDGRQVSLKEFSMVELLSIGETIRAEEIVFKVPDGRSVTTLLNATPIRADNGEVVSLVVTLQDLTSLQELERMRAEFLGMVSHELRTPLATIKGSTTTLLNSPPEMDPAVVAQFLRIMDQQVDHLQRLIGDLLDVARVESGTLSIEPGPANISDMIDEAKNRLLNSGARYNLTMEIPPNIPPVVADRARVIQVLSNLLSNASRYSPEAAPITIEASSDGIFVAVSVVDQGRGIPVELVPHLFRRFPRFGSAEGRGMIDGSGLGLAICRGIIEAHGGRIWAESDGLGTGARFTFTLPVLDREDWSAGPRPSVSSAQPQHRTADKLRVLAVDDDPQALRYIRDTLVNAGYEPFLTGSPANVMSLVEEGKPDLILLDLMFPGVDGIELMKEILEWRDIPVIFISAYGQEDVVARAFDLGASDYVVKPFSPTELAARIRAALRKRTSLEERLSPDPFLAGDLLIDYAFRRVTLAGENVPLTPTEYRLLYELSVNAGRVLSHDQLLQAVWGPERKGDHRLLRDVVKRLRRKLGENADSSTYILTEPRIGYRMVKGFEEFVLEVDSML